MLFKNYVKVWLVKDIPDKSLLGPAKRVCKGFFLSDDDSVAHVMSNADTPTRYTIKISACGEDGETYTSIGPISESVFRTLWHLAASKNATTEALRYHFTHDNVVMALDVYQGQLEGFALAAAGFDFEEDADSFIPPHWCGMEVTHHRDFTPSKIAITKLGSGPYDYATLMRRFFLR